MAATRAEVQSLRLLIHDPTSIIAIVDVDELPTVPANQFAYYLSTDSEYHIYDSLMGIWSVKNIELSDASLIELIDLYGVYESAPRAIRRIAGSLGRRLSLARLTAGAESIEYVNLSILYKFYDELAKSMEVQTKKDSGNNVGRYLHTMTPRVGGDLIRPGEEDAQAEADESLW